jgi:septal ring factor EnvC (AmiA/AmiB activator)
MPVKGRVISNYGTYVEPQSGATNFRKGIEIQAERGAPISAVFSGQIVYADWLKGYGNVIIITHGDNFYTVYAHAEDLFRKKGDNVEADDVIATVGDTGSMSGPTLYFEIRHHGNTEDPLKWIKKG